ncbi:glycosyltransferase [Brevundimonas mediterranea]|uniref:Glycosyltransferase involved in cell wall biosynthesis n=1 Tax=Brevundimonas mediterranea TaxID=74329 RepID=A0A7W6A444_9CAUL|nr:glycosyltransferase [Brevundimonas mediterranea]MBB3872954.1 glycosyltransferase involved in cell wall biosynthesis [Brevundimonas mediterranea]
MTTSIPTKTQDTLSPEEYVSLLYSALLGRAPDTEGLKAHSKALRTHGDHSRIIREITSSPEYLSRQLSPEQRGKTGATASKRVNAGLSSRTDTLSFIINASKHYFSDPAFLRKLADSDNIFSRRIRPVKNIALYYWRLNNGGTERVTAREIEIWTRMGFNVILITDQEAIPDQDYDYGSEVKRYIIPERMMHNNSYPPRGRALADILQIEEIDLFVTNQWYEVSSVWDVMVAKSLGIPTIVGWHNVFDAGIHNLDDLGLANLRYLGYRHADLIAVLSSVDELWFQSWGVPARLVHNPLTFDELPTTLAPLDGRTIVWVARAEKHQKRIDHVLQMFPMVLAEEPDARLLIVGGGPDLDWAREYAASLGIGHRVNFTGYSKDVSVFIRRSAVHVMTSEFEGYPMVLGEVWAHGVPTVMYDLPHLEYLRSGRGHVVVEQKDVAGLASAVVALLRDKARRIALGAEARHFVEEVISDDLEKTWKDIFHKIGVGENPGSPPAAEQLRIESYGILVKMLGDKMLSLYGPNNSSEPQPVLPSQAPAARPTKRGTRRLVRAARVIGAPYAVMKKALSKPTGSRSRLRMIDLSHVGFGDNLMIWTGLFTLLEAGAPVCAPGCVIHVQPILADLCGHIFSRFGLEVRQGHPEREIRPIYTPLPPATTKEWMSTYFGSDWRMNWVEAVDLQKTLPRSGAENSFKARVRLFLSERFIYRRMGWQDAAPTYIGFRAWQPIAAKHGIYPTVFLSQMKRSLQSLRTIMSDYVDDMTSESDRDNFRGNAAFPAGKSFQTIPPLVYKKVNQILGGDYFSCYVQNDSAWHNDFQSNGVQTKNITSVLDTFRIIKYSNSILTTDSFTSHIAQILRDDFTLVLSRDFQESILHPGANPTVVANHPACAPCNYQERYHFDRCVAGYKYCLGFESDAFINRIASAVRMRAIA